MRRILSLLMMLISLWLPIQAAAAVTMPFCRHAPEQTIAAAAHCHEQALEQVTLAKAGDLDCGDCSLCHFACSGFLLAAGNEPNAPPMASILVPTQQLASVSHIPEPPQQPPRR